MRWRGRRASANVEDRRFSGKGGLVTGGIGTVLLVLALMYMGVDPQVLMESGVIDQGGTRDPAAISPAEQEAAEFVSVILADTEDVWHELFRQQGDEYAEPKLVLFTGRVQSACGFASAAVGPFYCPADSDVYLDLQFFEELHRRFGAPGDFARAYVIAHEIGHHVQNLTGVSDQVGMARQQLSETEANQMSVRLELQADYLAGVWAHHIERTKRVLDPNDIEEALTAASAIGDDRLQRQSQGTVVPDSFTHGTSAQRLRWFRQGYETGDYPAAKALFQLNYEDL